MKESGTTFRKASPRKVLCMKPFSEADGSPSSKARFFGEERERREKKKQASKGRKE
jgi:hypothetical protein